MTRDLQFPAGFRFHPTDKELVRHYLVRKCASQPIAAPVVAEIDLYKFDPWDLPDRAPYGENEWYFFSPRDRKYPNGSRPNRAAGSGYWKATGADKPIGKPRTVGIKKALVFYAGKSPKGDKTNWIMHEYRLADVDRSAGKKGLRLDDWVLCRIYNKKGVIEKPRQQLPPPPSSTPLPAKAEEEKLQPLLMVPSRLPSAPTLWQAGLPTHDSIYFDSSESPPKLHPDSSCSEHAASPGFAPEVQSKPERKSDQWEKFCGLVDCYEMVDRDLARTGSFGEGSPQDIFMYLQEPF
ncbi:hypothetical protein MLD38_013045 [Melastoma candidum]|uniref:Uncharacterized protein n=1 Tax=Melastoma candidum TaxID=119954 RepID=A0ACB9RBY3_9MYRT|nr:hypothetical protein MLD38_013045 [Melastoma candidum]